MKKVFSIAILSLGLAACQTTPDSASSSVVSRAAIANAGSPSELLSMGARKLSASDIRSELVGQKLDEGGWTWNINGDGTGSSRSNDGSWTSTSTWDISGDQYCRQGEDFPRKCSDIYELGGIFRFSDTADTLAGWSVSIQ